MITYLKRNIEIKTNSSFYIFYPEKLKKKIDLFQKQFEHFSLCVASKDYPIVTGLDGVRNNQIISAAYESATLKRVVQIEN